MARGILYHIDEYHIDEDKRNERFPVLSADELICEADVAHAAEWIEEIPYEGWSDSIQGFLKYTYGLGLSVNADDSTEIIFSILEEGKEAYFAKKYERFRKIVEDLTLEKFSQQSWTLHDSITARYSDAVMFCGAYCEFDDMVRALKPHQAYVIRAAYLMH